MNSPLISCIVPVYNGQRFIRQALASIVSQTYRHLEFIVVDDGSTDNTEGIVKDFTKRIRFIRQAHSGPSVARNTGICAAQGTFIAFLDCDDKWVPDKLALQLSRYEVNANLGICVGHAQNFWEPEAAEEEARNRDQRRAQPVPGYVSGTILARAGVFDRIGLFNPKLKHGDATEWFMRAKQAGVVIDLLPEVLLYRRLHKHNRSRQWAVRSREEFIHLVKASLDQKRSNELDHA